MLRFISLFVLTFFLSLNAGADTLESVMMPGKVIQGHAKWEDDCKQCHKKFDKEGQNQLCKDCHKDINKDVAQKKGLHGKLKESRNCVECHTEHKGRAAQIAPINEKTFKHSQTDFELKGAHADTTKTECKECHKPKSNIVMRQMLVMLAIKKMISTMVRWVWIVRVVTTRRTGKKHEKDLTITNQILR